MKDDGAIVEGLVIDSPQPLANDGRVEHYVHPGGHHVAPTAVAVRTILGSCVAVCLWDPIARVGGLNHYVLDVGAVDDDRPFHYGRTAVPKLITALEQRGAERRRLLARVLGGARIHSGQSALDIGARNVTLAQRLLAEQSIPVVGRDTGGPRGRRVIFHTDTGNTWVWRL